MLVVVCSSVTVTMDVTSAGLTGPSGGVALRFALVNGPIAFALTDEEARWLIAKIQSRLARAEAGR